MNLTDGILCLLLIGLTSACAASTKTERTYFTEARLKAAQENIARHAWARQSRDAVLAAADRWLAIPDEELRLMVPPPELPRDAYVHDTDCPVHGLATRKVGGTYAWKISLEHPFKVQCPVGGEFYPDNDFDAYYRSGLVNGRFDPNKADRSLLTGKIVDDGYGWKNPDGPNARKYWFVAYYTHWMLVQQVVNGVLRDCSRAYLLTGDARYAHKTALVLWQLAEYYPDYQYEKQSRYGLEIDHNYKGKLLYHTWECFTVELVALAYDAVFPALADDTTLQKSSGLSGAQLAEQIEARLLRQMARLIMDGSRTIQGNYGMHQAGLLTIALVCGDEENEPRRSAMVDWVLNNDKASIYTEFSLYDALYNIIFRDGVPFESPGYNLGWLTNLMPVAEALKRCGVDIFAQPRFRLLYDWPVNMTVAGRLSPALGDSGNMFHGLIGRNAALYEKAFRYWRDPRYAAIRAQARGTSADQLFEESLDEEIGAAAATAPEIGTTSFQFPGYGMSLLQTGAGTDGRTGLMLYQGARRSAHAHFDNLHLDLYAKNHALTPDFGYPETANSQDPRRWGFFSHTMAHNTVMVNATRAEAAFGHVTTWDTGDYCQVVDAHAEGCYPGVVSRYRRTVALVDLSPQDAYIVDIFRVQGGRQHDWIVHGTDADFEAGFPLTPPRAEGTLAGADVPYGHFYDDERMAKAPVSMVSYVPYRGSGFMYLYNVQEGALEGVKTASWLPKRRPADAPEGQVVLRAHLAGANEKAFVCDGKPQQNSKTMPEAVKFLVRRREGENLESTFVTVFEPYLNEARLRSVARLESDAADDGFVALRIERADGLVDLFFSALDSGRVYRLTDGTRFQGEVGTLTLDGAGRVRRAHLSNGGLLERGDFRLEGAQPRSLAIQAVDYQRGQVTLTEDALTPAQEGRWVVIANNRRSTLYRIEKVIDARTFSIGDQDPRCGRLLPVAWDPEQKQLRATNWSYAAEAGMHLVDEAGKALGQVTQVDTQTYTLEPAGTIRLEELPETDGDGRRRVWVMDFAPGDTARVGAAVTMEPASGLQ